MGGDQVILNSNFKWPKFGEAYTLSIFLMPP